MSTFGIDNDFVVDVLKKLRQGRYPSASIVDKALVFYAKLIDKLKRYKDELNEKGTVEVDKVEQDDLGRNELYKMMEASARNNAENEKLKQELMSTKREVENLTKRINALVETKNDHSRHEDAEKKELYELKEANETLDTKIANLNQDLELAQKKTANKEKQAKALEESLQKLRNENKSLKSENTELKRELESAKSEIDSQSKQTKEFLHQGTDKEMHFESIRRSLTEENEILRSENAQLKENLKSAEEKIQSHSKVIKGLTLKVETSRYNTFDKKEMHELREANKKLRSDIKNLAQEIESTKFNLALKGKQVEEAHQKAKIEDAEMKDNSKSADEKTQSYSKSIKESILKVESSRYINFDKKEIHELRDANKTLRSDIMSLAQEVESAKFNLDLQTQQAKKAHLKATSRKEEIGSLKQVNEKLSNNTVRLERDLQRANDKVHILLEERKEEKQNAAKYREEVNTLNKRTEILSSDNVWLDRELKVTKDKMQRLLEERKKEKRNALSSREDVYRESHDNGSLSSKNIWLESELKATRDKLQRVVEERNTEKQNTAKSRDEVYNIDHDNERLRSMNAGLKNELKTTREKMERLLEDWNEGKQKDINRRQDTDYPRRSEKEKEQIRHLSDENKKLQDQVHELKNRLSTLAGHKMTADNPNIADLSDAYRPTNIAEQFRQLYDNEWTQAYEELDKQSPDDETKLIETLVTILKNVEMFCVDVSSQQFDTLKSAIINEVTYPKFNHRSGTVMAGKHRAEMSSTQLEIADKLLKDMRKSLGILSTGPLAQIFHAVYMSEHMGGDHAFPIGQNAFVVQSVKLVWMMKMQTPPMGFIWAKPNHNVDKNKFTFYTKRGDVTKQCVWPAIELHKNGPLMSKGIVQAM